MANITMSIEENLLKTARKIAVDRDTTLSDLFRATLTDLVRQEEIRRGFVAEELDRLFGESVAQSGQVRWTREDLHER